MNWDICIALGMGLTQVAVTWYGVHVSVADHRIRNAVIIGVVGGIGVILTVVGTIRNGMTQEALQRQLDQINRNTRLHASIKIEPKSNNEAMHEPLNDVRPLLLNFMQLNLGNQAAKNNRLFSHTFIEYGRPETAATVELVWQEFSQWMHDTDKRHATGSDLPFGIPYWSTNEPPFITLTKNQITDIQAGKAHIFLTVSLPFEDGLGSHTQEACFYIQEPANRESPWHDCGLHDGQIDGTQATQQ